MWKKITLNNITKNSIIGYKYNIMQISIEVAQKDII